MGRRKLKIEVQLPFFIFRASKIRFTHHRRLDPTRFPVYPR